MISLRLCVLAASFALLVPAAVSVSLSPSVASPAPLGTVVEWSANSSAPGTLWYRYRARPAFGEFRMVRDYNPDNTLAWAPAEHEGWFEVEVSVQNRETGETGMASVMFELTPRVSGNSPVISPTAIPVVFLYSAPPCASGSRMRVEFGPGPEEVTRTPWKDCLTGLTMNFYLAGFRPETPYTVRHVIESGAGVSEGPGLTITSPVAAIDFPAAGVVEPQDGPIPSGVLLHGITFRPPVATDLAGNVIWYAPGMLTFLTRPVEGGGFFGILQDLLGPPSQQFVREFDLAGTVVRETNAGRVNDQLAARGVHPITSFHHDAVPLPGGKVLVLGSTEQIFTDVQGPGPVNVLGEMILVLDRDLQVEWTWDAFEHLDVSRKAILSETCASGTGGCPPFVLAPQANDWLHANSLQLTPDGNILMSIRHQDWVIKIDYENGAGNGAIIWRLGPEGDFQILSTAPSPWFSHTHDANLNPDSTLSVFDNGNVRNASDPNAHSRGQVLRIDEDSRRAELVLNADLGDYSFALGTAQRLPDGNYHFDMGWLGAGTARYVEVDPSGRIVYAIDIGAPVYRAFRMPDLYTP